MEEIKIEIIKFKSKDGKIFDTVDEALIQDDIIDGKKKICPKCNGYKTVTCTDEEYRKEWESKCKKCDGKGFLELKWC